MRLGRAISCNFLVLCLAGVATRAHADTIIYVDDSSGNIGQVDINNGSVVAGSVQSTGQLLTDIAFNSTGTLFGTTDFNLYSINPSTGTTTSIGSYSSDLGMNALVGNGGTNLLGAGFLTDSVYTINSATGATSTYGPSPAPSAGDLAFSGSTLYESALDPNDNDELVNVTTDSVIGDFHVGSPSGAELTAVNGLADVGPTMYAVDGTEVYSVNLSNAVLTPLFDYSTAENGQDLGAAYGAAAMGGTAVIPEPSSAFLLPMTLLGVALVARRRIARGLDRVA
jgi:hypothetical protein